MTSSILTTEDISERGHFVKAFAMTKTGASGNNGDAYYYSLENGVFSISDGASGAFDKQLASDICTHVFATIPYEGQCTPEDYLKKCFNSANQQLIEVSQRDGRVSFATLTAAVVDNMTLTLLSIGDTPAYLFRKGNIEKLTKPMKRYSQLVTLGLMTEAEAEENVMKLRPEMRSVFELFLPSIVLNLTPAQVDLNTNDLVLMACDGVTDYIEKEDLESVLSTEMPLEDIANNLLSIVLERCEPQKLDDMTLILIKI